MEATLGGMRSETDEEGWEDEDEDEEEEEEEEEEEVTGCEAEGGKEEGI